MATFYDGYEAIVNGAVGSALAYLKGTHKGQALLMEFGEKALINILATSLSKYFPLMQQKYVDQDREYLVSALLAAFTKTWKKGRSGVSLAGEQALVSVLAHRLSMGSTGWSQGVYTSWTGTTQGATGAAGGIGGGNTTA